MIFNRYFKHILVFFLIALLYQSSFYGQKLIWEGTIYHTQTNEKVSNINIVNNKSGIFTTSNKNGEFTIFIKEFSGEIIFNVTSIEFENKEISISSEMFTNGKLAKDIYLKQDTYEIPVIEVNYERPAPDTIFALPSYNVGDFCFIEDKKLILVYEKEKRWKKIDETKKTYYQDCKLVLLDSLNEEIDNYPLSGLYFALYTEFLDQVFLISDKENYLIYLEKSKIKIASIDLTTFTNNIMPVVDSLNNIVIATTYNAKIPAFEYYSLDQKDSTYKSVHHVSDEEVLEVFRSEYKYMTGKSKLNAYRYELSTGIDKEIVAAFMTGFADSWFVKPLYAPAFTENDTLIIFDHYSDMIFRYDTYQNPIDSVEISYHKAKRPLRWKKEVIRDNITGKFYAKLEKNGYTMLYQINTITGETDDYYKLFYKYVERIRIVNNEVFYVYRPFESSQKKYLYKEKL